MTWSDFYLFCFIVGFALSAASFFAGAVHIHLPFKPHLPSHAGHHGGASGTSHAGAHTSWLNASTAMAFLAWFGGTGYILTRSSNLIAVVSLGIAISSGFVAAWLVFKFMLKLTRGSDSELCAADYRIEGTVATISIPIRANGTGEVIFSLGGVRRSSGARCEGGKVIEKGSEVVIERYEKGIAYVKSWDEFTR